MKVYEVEVWLSTSDALKAGVTCLDWRKYLVAASSSKIAVRTAVDMAWRPDQPDRTDLLLRPYRGEYWQVTGAWYVP